MEHIQPEAQRFNDQRRKLKEQLVAFNRSKAKESSAIADDATSGLAGVRHNLALTDRLTKAFATIDELFLDNKRVDDPAAPLPSPA